MENTGEQIEEKRVRVNLGYAVGCDSASEGRPRRRVLKLGDTVEQLMTAL